MNASLSLEMWPPSLVDKLVYHILQARPELISAFLSAMGKRIHASAVLAEFTLFTIPDEALCFFDRSSVPHSRRHKVSAILSNPGRYASVVKRIIITDAGLPPRVAEIGDMAGLVHIEDEDSDSDNSEQQCRIALQPIPATFLNDLLAVCSNLEALVWRSTNPPPDGICESIAQSCPRLTEFIFWPELPLKAAAIGQKATAPSPTRIPVPKWDAPSLPLLSTLHLRSLHISRLTLPGSRALIQLFSHFGEECPLQDIGFDFVWLDDTFCRNLVEAGRRLKRLKIGTSGTKLTDAGIVAILDGCEALEEFSLVGTQGRLSRSLWSKVENLPTNLRNLRISMSEAGPHHSWTADHLQSFQSLRLNTITHLFIVRTLPLLQLSQSGDTLEYDPHIEDVAILKPIPRDIVAAIRNATALAVLECDWWSWKPDDLKALLERCALLERLKLAFDAPFSKLLTLTAAFTPLTHLLKLSICIPRQHSPGQIPALSPSEGDITAVQPLTPAASPVRQRKALPLLSSADDFAAQAFCTYDSKFNEGTDPSLPPLRDVKRFVKKCPRLIELEWYGRNARGTWVISRPVATSKINTNVSVEYYPPIAPPAARARAKLEGAANKATIQLGASLAYNVTREGVVWSGLKCAQLMAERAEKEGKECSLAGSEKLSRIDVKKRSPSASTDRKGGGGVSPVVPYTPLSPTTPMIHFHDSSSTIKTGDHSPTFSLHPLPNRRQPSDPPVKNSILRCGRSRSATESSIGTSGADRTIGLGFSSREGRGRGQSSSKASGNAWEPDRSTTNSGGSTRAVGGNGNGGRRAQSGRGQNATSRGGKLKGASTRAV